MAKKNCPVSGYGCDKKYSCEHRKNGACLFCMKREVRKWINEEPPYDSAKQTQPQSSAREQT